MPETIQAEVFTDNLFALLVETFESSPNSGSIYLDKQAGLFDTLNALDAQQASQDVNGTSIAAQLVHTDFYLRVLERYLEGATEKIDWRESWRTHTVTPDEWETLKAQLRADYERISAKLHVHDDWDDNATIAMLSPVVHSAYHLGAIRQLAKQVRINKEAV